MNTQNITSLDRLCYEAVHSSISQNIVHILKSLAWNAEKTLQLKITKKMNITNFINIYANMYIPILYVTEMAQNKNDSINSCY